MADIFFRCSACAGHLVVDGRGAGLQLPCPFCAQSVTIPLQDQQIEAENVNGQPVKESKKEATTVSTPTAPASTPVPTTPFPTEPAQLDDQDDAAAALPWADGERSEEEIRRLAAMMNPDENIIDTDQRPSRMISFRCSSCGQVMTAKRSQAGSLVQCTACAGDVQVPLFKQPAPGDESHRSATRVTLPVGRNKTLRTADDIRKASAAEVAGAPEVTTDLDSQFQEMIRRELVRMQTGEAPPSTPTAASEAPASDWPRNKKPLPPLAEHGEVVPVPGQTGPVSHPRPNPSLRSRPKRAADAPLPPLVTMDSMDLDSEVARNWGEHAIVPTGRLNWLAAVIILTLLCVGGYFGYHHLIEWVAEKEAADEANTAEAEEGAEVEDPQSIARDAAIDSLKQFHEAVSAEAKSVFVRNREAVRPLMEAYYDVTDAESRLINWESSTFDRRLVGDRWFFRVQGEYEEDFLPFTADLEETADGRYLLDWKSWVGYSETPLTTFAQEGLETAHTFRVRVDLGNYYRNSYLEKDYRNYRLKDKNETARLSGYARKDSPVDKRLISLFREGMNQRDARFILSLRFAKSSDKGHGQVLIEDLVSESWIEEVGK